MEVFVKDLYSSHTPFSNYYWGEFQIKNIFKVYENKYVVYFFDRKKKALDQFELLNNIGEGIES